MWTRRELLRLGGLSVFGGAAMVGAGCRPASHRVRPTEGPPDFTAAFLTDPHVHGTQGAAEGFARAVDHAWSQARAPVLFFNGGDLAFDCIDTGRSEADAQYHLTDGPLASVKVPIHHALGNHDLFGLSRTSGVSRDDPLRGKAYFLERFGLERSYSSFDHEGWHFVMLDTLQVVDDHYRGWIDAEQLAWLEDDLAAANKPTVVVGHIPLFTNYIELRRGTRAGIPETVAVVNCNEVAAVLLRHPVKLVLAGHLHIVETFHYKGIEFANLGAISGDWWKGTRDGFEEGYSVLEFRGDRVSWRYVDYGWEALPVEEA